MLFDDDNLNGLRADRSVIFEVMVVAFCLDNWHNTSHSYQVFIHKIVETLASQHPDKSFYWISERRWTNLDLPSNVSWIQTPAFGSFLKRIKQKRFVKKQLEKIEANTVVTLDRCISLNKAIPQYIFLSDAFSNKKGKSKEVKAMEAARAIFVPSVGIKKELIALNPSLSQKITVVYGSTEEVYQPLNYEEQLLVKEKYTGGTEYLFYQGSILPPQLVQLLKAFSAFKKRQKTSMKMVLALDSEAEPEITKLLANYLYRDDVVRPINISQQESGALLSAAYGYIHPLLEKTCIPAFNAFRSGCPLIATIDAPIAELGNDVALFYQREDISGLAEKMMRLYKDEETRAQLIQKGFDISKDLNWQKAGNIIMAQMEGYNS